MSGDTNQTYFITGGGTGGHVYPAVAIADALLKEPDTQDIYYVGNPENLEKKIAETKGFKFLDVNVTGMPRRCGLCIIKWGFDLLVSTIKSLGYILKYRPSLIFGTGGYVSAPMIFAGIMTKTPIVIHDCDAAPGIVSKTAAPYVNSISVAFEVSKDALDSRKIFVNGNPVREEFASFDRKSARELFGLKNKLTIMVMGGSQGAKKLNSTLVNCLKDLFLKYDMQVIHQTGQKNYDAVIEQLNEVYPEYEENPDYVLAPYFDEMYLPLIASDIAVSRAGSLSISEICSAGVASILVPYPHAAADHQRKNAREMEALNAAIYLDDNDCSPESLSEKLETLINNSQKMMELQNEALSLSKPFATQNIVNQIKDALKK